MLGPEKIAESDNLQVVFLLDITGSMDSQISAMKSMIQESCSKLEQDAGLDLHVWCFTESPSCCYVCKSPAGASPTELVQWTNEIKLSTPPGFPGVNAWGGDGPENVVAAIASLTESFLPSHNIVVFVITDAPPHHKSYGRSSEALAERRWLQDRNFESFDPFVILNQVFESLKVTFVPVLFGTARTSKFYLQAASLTDGILLAPESTDSRILSASLVLILAALQSANSDGDQLVALGFHVCIPDQDFEVILEDPTSSSEITFESAYIMDPSAVGSAIVGLVKTAFDKFDGKKAGRRCRSVDPEIVQLSVKVLVTSLLFLHEKVEANELDYSVKALAVKLTDLKTDTCEYELKLLNHLGSEAINELRCKQTFNKRVRKKVKVQDLPVKCVISLESALEHIEGLESAPRTEDDVKSWMDIVLQSLMCRIIEISFPLNAFGNPDFADAWAAVIKSVSMTSTLSASAVMMLRDSSSGSIIDPIDRKSYNAGLILSHPNDAALSTCYRALSCLPSLQGLIQGYLISGGLKLFPSITVAIQAGVLVKVINNVQPGSTLSTAEWELVRMCIHSIQSSMGSFAKDVVDQLLEEGHFNPADNISKLVAATIRVFQKKPMEALTKSQILSLLFDEMAGTLVQLINRIQRQSEDFKTDLPRDEDVVSCLVTSGVEDFDPIAGYHEVELVDGFQLQPSHLNKLTEMLQKSKAYQKMVASYQVLCDVLLADPSSETVAWTSHCSLTDLEMAYRFLKSLILKKRSCFYALDQDKLTWTPLSDLVLENSIVEACSALITSAYRANNMEWNEARQRHAKANLLDLLLKVDAESMEEYSDALKNLEFSLLGKIYKIDRMDATLILSGVVESQLPTLGKAVLIGDWASEPPCQLRRSIGMVQSLFAPYPDLLKEIEAEILKMAVCSRSYSNRHGHSLDLQYCGPLGWTQEYDDARRDLGFETQLDNLKQFSLFAEQIEFEEMDENSKILTKAFVHSFSGPDFAYLKSGVAMIQESEVIKKMDHGKLMKLLRETSVRKHQPRRILALLK